MYKNEQTCDVESGMWAPFPSRYLKEFADVKMKSCNIQVAGALKSLATFPT
jgi:hypothetical protein